MAEEEVGLRLSLRDRRETAAGLRDTEQGLDRVGRSAETSGRRAKLASRGFSALRSAAKVGFLALAAGATAAVAASVGFVKSAAEDQKSAKRLAVTLRNTTGARRRDVRGIEDWITAQGKAVGVADDDLRPAIGKLATATGDLGEAQRLTSLAMDVSAGSGKSLDAVSTALARAQGGTLTALNRLSPGLVDVKDKTVTLDQVTDKLAKRFGGQAAVQAGTAAGKYDRMKLALSETGEAIGYQLLPYANKLGDWLLDKGIPLVEKWGGKIGTDAIPAVERFARKARPLVDQVLPAVSDGLGTIRDVAGQIEGPLTRVFKAFNGLPDWAKSAIALGAGGAVVAKKVGALSLGSKVAGGALGLAKSAKPIPVFVTNAGGLPGTAIRGTTASTAATAGAGATAGRLAALAGAGATLATRVGGGALALGGWFEGKDNLAGQKITDANNKKLLDSYYADQKAFAVTAAESRASLTSLLTGPLPKAAGKSITDQMLGPLVTVTNQANTLQNRLGVVGKTKVDPKITVDAVSAMNQARLVAQTLAQLNGTVANTYVRTVKIGANTSVVEPHASIPGRAHGGPVTAGRPYVVGERNAELFVPRVNGVILPKVPDLSDFDVSSADLRMGTGADGEVHLHVHMDGHEVTEVVKARLRDGSARL